VTFGDGQSRLSAPFTNHFHISTAPTRPTNVADGEQRHKDTGAKRACQATTDTITTGLLHY